MALTAIISDIHGNLPALVAVVADAKRAGVTRFWCLGDIVGYGAQPLECIDIVRELSEAVIRGNHEQAVIERPYGFNPLASAAIFWTQAQLANGHAESLEYLRSLGEQVLTEHAVLYHGSPSFPLDEYLFREDTLDYLPRSRDFSPKLTRCFNRIDRPCFVGHTHVPGVIDSQFSWVDPVEAGGRYDTEGKPCIVNVGSVGQPRDGDRRASYGLFDGTTVTFRRVDYDVEAAAEAIFAEDALPDMLGQRLLEAW